MSKVSALLTVFLAAYLAGFASFGNLEGSSFGALNKLEAVSSERESVVFVGDVMLARNLELLMDRHGTDYPFIRLDPFRSDSYVVGNFESSMLPTHKTTPFFTFAFATKIAHMESLREVGFTHLGLANNHTLDYGGGAFSYLKESILAAGMTPFGHALQVDEAAYSVLSVSGTKVAVMGVHALNGEPSDEVLAALFAEMAEVSDLTVVYVHWGTEYEPWHSRAQERFATRLVRHGADLIVGHHPHVVQDVAIIEDVPVFYSLGNFIFDQYFSREVQEGLTLQLKPTTNSFSVEIRSVTSIDMQSAPRPHTADEQERFLQALAERSDPALSEMIRAGRIVVTR